jgi:hypothetical protein
MRIEDKEKPAYLLGYAYDIMILRLLYLFQYVF